MREDRPYVVNVTRQVECDHEAWNRRLMATPEGSWRQSTWYGEYKRALWREEAVYLLARNGDGEIVGQLLAFFAHPHDWSLYRRNLSGLNPLLNRLLPRFYWFEGPLVFDRPHYGVICDALVEWMVAEASARGCIGGLATPSFYHDDAEVVLKQAEQVYGGRGFTRNYRATLLVDLREDLDTLFGNLKKDARNKVRKARKQDVRIVEIGNDEASLQMLEKVNGETARRNGMATLSYDSLRKGCWSHYCPHGYSKGFVSLHGGELVSAQQAVAYNGVIGLGGVSYTDYSRLNRIYGNDLMQWHCIEWGKANGMRILDVAGIEPHANSAKKKAIYDFKAKWGGREVVYGEYVIDLPSFKGRAYRYLLRTLGAKAKDLDRRIRR